MAVTFSSFTTIFFFLVSLIIMGIIFEKQFIALEDKFDAWVASKRNADKKRPAEDIRPAKKKARKSETAKDEKYRGFAA